MEANGSDSGPRIARRVLRALPWILVCLGIAFRVSQWAGNLSLEMAEVALAMDVIESGPAQLLEPLARDQGAPIGFLLAERAVITLWNEREPALRAFPLLCGIVAMIAFVPLARRYVAGAAVPVAVGLFAVAPGAILASRLAKQYSGDVAVTVLLLWGMGRLADARPRLRDGVLLGVAGSIALCFSHPAVFVLAGTGGVLGVSALRAHDRERLFVLAIAVGSWLATFAALYAISYRKLATNDYLVRYWSEGFAPFPPHRLNDLQWFPQTYIKVFRENGGLLFPGLAGLLAILGAIACGAATPRKLMLLVSPALPALAASALKRYPIDGHLAYFLLPPLILLVGAGVALVGTSAGRLAPAVTAATCLLLFYDPVATENRDLFRPAPYQEARPVVTELAKEWRSGDRLYVYHEAQYTLEYYARMLAFRPDDVIVGKSESQDWDEDLRDIERLRGKPRVFLLFHDPQDGGTLGSEERFFVFHLDRVGTRLSSLRSVNASLYLYDLSPR